MTSEEVAAQLGAVRPPGVPGWHWHPLDEFTSTHPIGHPQCRICARWDGVMREYPLPKSHRVAGNWDACMQAEGTS